MPWARLCRRRIGADRGDYAARPQTSCPRRNGALRAPLPFQNP
jgi:hypothetical protein